MRAVDDASDEVREAVAVVRAATKSTRRAAIAALRVARKVAREAAHEEIARITALEDEIRKAARASTTCYWGSYLDIEAAHNQARQAPLYGDDAISPSDPRFRRWTGEGQVGVQLQGGLATSVALAGNDTRVRLAIGANRNGKDWPRYGVLSIRVGSESRSPVWAEFPIKCHRAVPDSASWKWVRVSVRREGLREQWTAEITIDDSAASPRSLDRSLSGTIAVEWEWTQREDGSICVAQWADDRGGRGEVVLPTSIATGIRKPDGIRAVRDIVLNDLRPKLARSIRESRDAKPRWLVEAANILHLWKSPDRFRALAKRWREERCDACRPAYEMLDAWEMGTEGHLYEYESGARREALRERRDWYRVLAARWGRSYRTVLLSDQDLSFAARRLDDGDVRYTAACAELRGCVRNVFGDDAIDARWRDGAPEDDERAWCERTRDAWEAGGARGDGMFAARKEKVTNAWASRKAKKKPTAVDAGVAREAVCNSAK